MGYSYRQIKNDGKLLLTTKIDNTNPKNSFARMQVLSLMKAIAFVKRKKGIKKILPLLNTSNGMKYAQWIMVAYPTIDSLRPLGRGILSKMMYGFLWLVQTHATERFFAMLIIAGGDVNYVRKGRTLLMYAAEHAFTRATALIFAMLVMGGAEVDRIDLAREKFDSQCYDFTVIDYALSYETAIDYEDSNLLVPGKYPAHVLAVIKVLLGTDAVQISGLVAEQAINALLSEKKPMSTTLEVVKLLHEQGADVRQGDDGMTPFMWLAAYGCDGEYVLPLLEFFYGLDEKMCWARSHNGWTALMFAADHGNPETAKWLLSRTITSVNWQDQKGRTALMLAANKMGDDDAVEYRLETLRVVLSANPDLNSRDCSGKTALDFAVKNGWDAAVELLDK